VATATYIIEAVQWPIYDPHQHPPFASSFLMIAQKIHLLCLLI